MLTNYCYQTDIRFQSLNCPVPSPLLCGLDIGYSGISRDAIHMKRAYHSGGWTALFESVNKLQEDK